VQICTSTVDLARGDQAVNHRDRIPLHEMVDQVGASLGLGLDLGLDGGSSVNWHNRVPATLVVEADHDRLFRVFVNLGRNADKALNDAGRGGGNITVSAETTPEGSCIRIADDGPGLPPNAMDNLFQPFTSASSRGGTGLGLTTARDLMRAHGGELTLEHSSDQGATFRLDLPAGEMS
jgi:signal transduction histidine kinase